MFRRIAVLAILPCLLGCAAYSSVGNGARAQYYVQPAIEGQTPPIVRIEVIAGETEEVNGKLYQWWEMIAEKPEGSAFGIRVLSREVAMTSSSSPGDIVRYIYAPCAGAVLDYRDERTGKALLPAGDFVHDLFPRSATTTKYTDGFATTGRILGHVLIRSRLRDDFPQISFNEPKVLVLRSDLLIGSQADIRQDEDPTIPPMDRPQKPYTKADYEEMIAAGANYFGPRSEIRSWLQEQPVFWRGTPHFPDDLYRSNWVPGRMFLDEPMIRFGWNQNVPSTPLSPEMVSEAILTRVAAMERPSKRVIETSNYAEIGDMELIAPPTPVWETEYHSAWYQMAGGASGFVHEGRYRQRGYGWSPETLFGEGLENLTDRDMFDYYYAFMRGAARTFGGWWGTAIYSESDPKYRIPAIISAYEKGARAIWFWTYDDVDFANQIRMIKALTTYARLHPRPNIDELVKKARVGIVLPSGYMISDQGIRGMDPEQINDKGVSYGDIACTAIWEGIISSRRGLEYDFLVDHQGIEKMGYEQLYYIQTDGTIRAIPARRDARAPKDLRLSLEPAEMPVKTDRQAKPEYRIARSQGIRLDGDFSDWVGANWITMDGDPYVFHDSYFATVTVTVPEWVKPDSDRSYLGFTYEQMTPELKRKYRLEFWPTENATVVTSITPGSPAEQGGLRVGDAILEMNGRRAIWAFQVWGFVDDYRKHPGAKIEFKVKRPGVEYYSGSSDLSAKLAFAVDDDNFYIAAEVKDDLLDTFANEWSLSNTIMPAVRMGDCVQIGLDPICERLPDSYGENGHEIGLGMRDGKGVAWRWKGRRGQPKADIPSARVAVKRNGDKTLYEAAIPISEIAPFNPDIWPLCAMDIVVNDADGPELRQSRLELKTWAMTDGKHPADFAIFECDPSVDKQKISAAIFWQKRCLQPGGYASVSIVASSPGSKQARIRTVLSSLDDTNAKPAHAEIDLPISPDAKAYTLRVATQSPPGRYRLAVEVADTKGKVVARDQLAVYVYP